MGARSGHDPYGILDDLTFLDDWNADSIQEALRKAERAPGSGPDRVSKPRCNVCLTTRLRKKPGAQDMPHKVDTTYVCVNGHHQDTPRAPLEECPVEHAWRWLDEQQRYRTPTDTLPMNTPFNWLSSDDLEDPDERGFTPAFAGLGEETRVELAIRLYRPWTDDGPGYRKLAELFPHGRAWIGERVRAWKRGEYRELVERPGPTADASSDATAIATDGGEPRSRWAAYGAD